MNKELKKVIKYFFLFLLCFSMIFSFLNRFGVNSTQMPPQFSENPVAGQNNNLSSTAITIIEDITVTKTETITSEFNAIGEFIESTTSIMIELLNNDTNDVVIDFFDRIEGGYGFTPAVGTSVPQINNQHGLLLLNWSSLEIRAQSQIVLSYLVDQNKTLPVKININYLIDGVPITPDEEGVNTYRMSAPLRSNLTISVTLTNQGEGLFVTTKTVKPVTIAMVTLALPSDLLSTPTYSTPPIMSNEMSGINQITFVTLLGDEPVTLNLTSQVIEGGGWGLIELEPLRVDVIRSPETISAVISAVNALLGVVTGLEGYWAYLTIESMIDQFTLITPLLELLVNILVSDFTVFNTIINSLIHIEGTTIEELLNNLVNGPSLIRNLISLENVRGMLNSSFYPLLDEIILNELNLIENSTVQAIGSQMLALLGSPVDLQFYNFSLLENNTWDSTQMGGNLTALIVSNDLDRNGISEIIVAYNWTKDTKIFTNISIFENQTFGDFTSIWNSPPLEGITANNCLGTGDSDLDNDRELFIGLTDNDGNGNISIFEFNTTLDLNEYEFYNITFQNAGITSLLAESELNLDNDTNLEFVIGLNNGSVYIINGSWESGVINWTIKWSEQIDGSCNLLTHGDTDQDYREEIMCSNSTQISVFENTSLGFRPLKNLTVFDLDLITGDSDSDSKLEMLTCNDTWINIFEPNISITIIPDDEDPTKTTIIKILEGYMQTAEMNFSSSISNATKITNLLTGDFNLNGRKEIVAANENGSILFYECIGDNQYYKTLEYTLNTTQYGIKRLVTGDVNNDGYLDLIIMGKDDKIHVILKPFDIYDLNIRISANLTMTEGTQTNLYVRIDLNNVLITYPFPPTLKNLTYIYNGTGPSLQYILINTVENSTSIDNYNTSVINEISPEGIDELSGVIGVWYRDDFNYTTGQPLPGAINLYDPIPGHILKGSYDENNITFKINIGHPVDLVVNYSFYFLPDLLFGLNLTQFPPYSYSFPGSNSTIPAIYPFIAYLFDIRTSPLIRILGNLTTSLSKQFLILNSTISPDIGLYKPIVFESNFNLIGILNIFAELQNMTASPFESGGGTGFTLPSDIPIDFNTLNQFGSLNFLSKLKMFINPRIHSRFLTNISYSGDFSSLEQAMNLLSLQTDLGLEEFSLFGNYTEYSDFPKGLNPKPILIKDLNSDGVNDTIFAINGFYPTFEIRALNSINRELLWDYSVDGPIVDMSIEGEKIRVVTLNIENEWIVANESKNSTIYTKNIIENQTSVDNRTVLVNYNISSYIGDGVIGVWNRNEFNFTSNTPFNDANNYYNESAGASFEGKIIHLNPDLLSNYTDLVINYTKKTNTIVTVNHSVKSVVGVWNASNQTGINYFTGGSFIDRNITLGIDLETPNSTVYIKYYYHSNASSIIYLLNFTGALIDSRENLINQSRFFNGTTYIPHTYIGPQLGAIQTPYIINCSTVQNPNNYLLLIFTEDSTYAINGTLETTPILNLLFNNTNNKNKLWEISTGEIENLFLTTDVDNNGENEFIFINMNEILYAYDLKNGSKLWNSNVKLGIVSEIKAEDIDNDGIKEIFVGSTNNKIYAFKGDTGIFTWFNETNGPINDLIIEDIDGNGIKEIIAGCDDNNIYAINGSNGFILWNYNVTGKVKSVMLGDVNGDNSSEVLLGSNENMIYCLNITNTSNISIYWSHNITGRIITFQFSRTSNSITLQYDLSDRIFEMAYQSMDQFIGSFMNTGSDMTFGIDSLLNLGTSGANIDLESLTNLNLPEGIGLINLMTFQLQTIMSLDELGQVSLAQREYTGKPEVREIGDNPNVNIIKQQTTATIDTEEVNLTRFEIFNNDCNDLIRLNYFAVILSDDNGSIPMNRCKFYMWNGINYIDIMNNQYYNLTLEMLDLTYDNITGELRFKPFIEIEQFDQKNATVDWKGRPIFIQIINYNGTLNISYWADISLIHPKVTYETVTSSISFSLNYPVFIVYAIIIPPLSIALPEQQFYEQLLSNPLFYGLFLILFTLFVEMSYLRKREAHHIHRLAYKNMIKWLKSREKKWHYLLEKGTLNKKEFAKLSNIKNRLGTEVQPRWYTEYCFEKIRKNRFLDMTFSVILLLPFWRIIGKRNRLTIIFNNMLSAIFGPLTNTLKKIGSRIKKRIAKKPEKIKEKQEERSTIKVEEKKTTDNKK